MSLMDRCPNTGCHNLKPVSAVDCGCGKDERKRQADRRYKDQMRRKDLESKPMYSPWTPRPKPKPLLSDSAQKAHDTICAEADLERMRRAELHPAILARLLRGAVVPVYDTAMPGR